MIYECIQWKWVISQVSFPLQSKCLWLLHKDALYTLLNITRTIILHAHYIEYWIWIKEKRGFPSIAQEKMLSCWRQSLDTLQNWIMLPFLLSPHKKRFESSKIWDNKIVKFYLQIETLALGFLNFWYLKIKIADNVIAHCSKLIHTKI